MPQIRSVSWPFDVHMMIGMVQVALSRAIVRVAWYPFMPGMTTSIRIRSGSSALLLTMASSPLSAVTTSKPFFESNSSRARRSVGESSTTMIFLIGMSVLCWLTIRPARGRGSPPP